MDSEASADVSFQEEQESQIDFVLYQNTDEQEFPAVVGCESPERVSRKQNVSSNNDEPGSDDTVLDDTSTSNHSPLSQHELTRSRVEETQFVTVERDTQPSVDYDVSPTTRRVLENTDSSSAILSPTVIALLLLERDEIINHPSGPEFRFAKAPDPSKMVLTRPPPGQSRSCQKKQTVRELPMSHESSSPMANRTMALPVMEPNEQLKIVSAAPATKIGSLPSCRGSSKDTFCYEECADSILPNTQAEQTHSMCQDVAQHDDAAGSGSPVSHSSPKPLQSCLSVETEWESAPNIRQPLKQSRVLVKSTANTELLETIKHHNFNKNNIQTSKQPSWQAKSGSPPFVEAALENTQRRNKIEFPTTATMSAVHTSANDVASAPITEEESPASMKCPNKRGSGAENLPDFTVDEMLNLGDNAPPRVSGNGQPPSRDFRRELSRNQRSRSRNSNSVESTSRYRTNRSPFTAPINRPLPEHRTQPQDVCEDQDLHNTRDSRVLKKGSPGTNSTRHIQSNNKVPIAGHGGLTGDGLLQMAAVMFTAERGQLDAASAQNKIQRVQIENFRKEIYALKARITHLTQENQELLKKKAEFRIRCERHKSSMNNIAIAQQDLKSEVKDLNQKTLRFLKENQREMETQLLEAKSQNFKDSKEILQEARLEIGRQNKTILILKRDIDNRLLDLQRERGIRETLQKQIENREKLQEELKAVLLDYQRGALSVLSSHEYMLKDALSTCVGSAQRWTECQELIKSLEKREPKPIPALAELSELIVTLSTNVRKGFQAAEDGGVQTLDAVTDRLSELKNSLELITDDQFAKRDINATNSDLREENVRLRETVQSRETEVAEIERKLVESQKELQHCRIQLAETKADLSKAIAPQHDDAWLQTQLQDLQTSFSLEKKKSAATASEAEKIRADLREQEGLTLLAQQEASNLKHQLKQINAKVSAFDAQKDSYVREMKDKSNILRIQMERDCRARLAEDVTRQNGIISGLRRQITEADDKLMRAQQSLQDAEKARSNEEAESQRLQNQVSTITTELNSLQDRTRLMEQTRNHTDSELSITQKELLQCMEVGAHWNSRAQENTVEFLKRFKEMKDRFQISQGVAEVEFDRLEAVGLALQNKDQCSVMLIEKIARHLNSVGVIGPGLTIFDWADGLAGRQSHQGVTDVNPPYSLPTGDLCDLRSSSQGSTNSAYGDFTGTENLVKNNKQSSSSAQSVGGYAFHAANSPHVLFNEDSTTQWRETENSLQSSYSKISSKKTGPESYTHVKHLKTGAIEVNNASRAIAYEPQPFQTTSEAAELDIRTTKYVRDSNECSSNTNKLMIATGAVIPDSQEDLMREQVPASFPASSRPTLRFAERSHNTIGGSPAVSRTGVICYGVQTLGAHIDKPKTQRNEKDHSFLGDQESDLRSTGSDEESSGLSEPPDIVDKLDFSEFMNSECFEDPELLQLLDGESNIDSTASLSVPSPKPNSSRARAGPLILFDEAKHPKGILKRTNSEIQKSDPTTSFYSNGKPSRNSRLIEPQSFHSGIAANRRLSRTMSGTKGSDGGTHRSLYNRPVAGSKDFHESSHFREQDAPTILTLSSSPVMGQPQRNSKKRTLSGISLNDGKRPTKILRSVRR